MIAPTNRLLFWLAMLLPFAGAGPLIPAAADLTIVLFAAFTALAACDALLGRRALRGLGVVLPELVRLSRGRTGSLSLRIRNESRRARLVSVGLALPESLVSTARDMSVLLPAAHLESALAWECTPSARGSYRVDTCYIDAASPFGLWRARRACACRCEVRVYPDLLGERRRVAAVFLNRGRFGSHAQRMVGQGRDFEKLREYLPGDSTQDVHWKATAKRGRPVTKLFQMERTQEIYVLIDASRLSGRRIGDDPALERLINAALVLGLAAERQGDHFGLITFSDRVLRFMRAGSGRAHYLACRDAVCALTPQLVAPDFDELFSFVRLRLRRRALLMVLSDLGDPVLSEGFIRSVEHVCRQHMVLVDMVRQPGVEPLFSAPDAQSLDEVYQKLGGHMMWRSMRELGQNLKRRGVALTMSDPDSLTTDLVTKYLAVKARQAL